MKPLREVVTPSRFLDGGVGIPGSRSIQKQIRDDSKALVKHLLNIQFGITKHH